MKFKKGSKVEVMSKKEVPVSWRCGEIISGNGHTYSVKYDCYPGSIGDAVVERVSRKAIRPCPPFEGFESFVVGDVVEVFDSMSWKIARVLKVLDRDHYLVRLLGIPQEFRIHKSSIRVRQSWQDNKWVVIGKGSGRCDDVKSNKLSTPSCYQKTRFQMLKGGDDHFAVRENAGQQESHMIPTRALKRESPYHSSILDGCTGHARKLRAIEKEGRLQRFVPAPLQEKVDAVANPQENMGEKYMHSSSMNKSNGHIEVERADSDSDECSVCSCSVNSGGPNKFPSHFVAGRCQVSDSLSSDAESSYGLGNQENSLYPPEEEVAASIHRLELHAYRCTLGVLYASGLLSWEQEALLTNLRISLRISNDEHLLELKNLISAGNGLQLDACIFASKGLMMIA
ncbi:uncharacterized protein LOC131316008 [Rhododendron vialii]|uniref:uncharacterized protein LOC131316008 n=1 Tax=Rhododendron vialii TaxID=182163 RepID=UPI00265E7F56|nr:uncharacterized protein LOC131316008 [Rhododendron vialii]